jgi:hypothetical protein
MITIPTQSYPSYTISVVLTQRLYQFWFDYNGREDRWVFHIGTETGESLVRNVKCVPNFPLLKRYPDRRLPEGTLMIVHWFDQDDTPPGLDELGPDKRCQLIYLEPGEEI